MRPNLAARTAILAWRRRDDLCGCDFTLDASWGVALAIVCCGTVELAECYGEPVLAVLMDFRLRLASETVRIQLSRVDFP